MNSIFISYRRDDSAAICGRMFESLDRQFGHGNVFKDVDSIPMGVPFPQYIASVLQSCSVTLVVIGRQWLDIRAPNGARRLDNPADNVRLEVEAAMRRSDMMVIPVLVEGATMPTAESLPESLRPLVLLNSAQVRNDPDYQGDIRRLQSALQTILLNRQQALARTAPASANGSPSVAAKFEPGRANRGALITLGALVLAVVIGVSVLFASGALSGLFGGAGAGGGDRAAVQTTITNFCQALHDSNFNAAYAYFSPHYKQTITSSSDVPNVVSTWGTASDCSEFGQGGFLNVEGTNAQDSVSFTVNRPGLGISSVTATVKLVKSGSDWQIDSIVA